MIADHGVSALGFDELVGSLVRGFVGSLLVGLRGYGLATST